MARFPFESTLVDQYSRIIVGGTVTVNLTGTSTAATVYAAETGSADADSQFTTGSDGTYKFWIDDGDYGLSQRFRLVLAGGTPFVTRTIDDVVVLPGITTGSTDTLTNKKLTDSSVTFVDDSDATKQLAFQCSGITTATTRTVAVVDASDTMVLLTQTQTLTRKNIGDPTDSTKDIAFTLSGATTGKTLTISSSHTDDRTLTVPDRSITVDNVNKTVWIPPMAFVDDVVGSSGDYPTIQLADGTSVTWGGTWAVPTNFNSLTSVTCVVRGGGTGNMYADFSGSATADGEADDTDTDSIAVTTYALTNDQFTFIDATATANGLTFGADHVIALKCQRQGGDGSDTVGAAVQGVGWIIVYS